MVRLLFTGDVRLVNKQGREKIFSKELEDFIKLHDVVCCNYEAPCITAECKPVKKIGPVLYQDSKPLELLLQAGFNLFNLANNHICDYGIGGLEETLRKICTVYHVGAGVSGRETYRPLMWECKGKKIGFISVAEDGFGACHSDNDYGYAWMFYPKLKEVFRRTKENCDYLICICHAGAEGFMLPLPEIRELYRTFIEWGGNLVVGHHPHMIQGMEIYRDKHIFYSLGNFAFDSEDKMHSPFNPHGIMLEVILNDDGEKINIIPTYYGDKVVLDSGSAKYFQTSTEMIKDEKEYQKKILEFCIKAYKNYYTKYFIHGVVDKKKLKLFKSIFTRKFELNQMWMFHNLAIETHRWICMRAVRELERQKTT